ncbi:MAG: deoxyribodipyrimidine photo-lyase [Rhodospirillaceae bacterium]
MSEPGQPPVLLWFRSDLRLADNPALTAAAMSGRPVIPVFIHDDPSDLGGASRWWLHQSLVALSRDIGTLGSSLVVRRGDAPTVLAALGKETGAATLHFNRVPRPREARQEELIAGLLGSRGIAVHGHDSALLFEPRTVRTQAGGNFKVFTAFWKTCMAMPEPSRPLPAPKMLSRWRQSVPSIGKSSWGCCRRVSIGPTGFEPSGHRANLAPKVA